MHNVHDFVNFNLNSVSNLGNTNAQPMPAPGNVQQPQQNNNSRSSSSSSSNSQQQQNVIISYRYIDVVHCYFFI